MKQKKTAFKWKFLVKFILKICLIAGVITALGTWVCCLHRMRGNQMFPSVRDGDLGIFYKWEACMTNDVILYERTDGSLAVGRIAAVPGQEVKFPEDGGYEVNGYVPTDEIPYPTYQSGKNTVKYPVVLGENEYFILNDFRSDTFDSREFGAVSESQIRGKLLFLLRRRGF